MPEDQILLTHDRVKAKKDASGNSTLMFVDAFTPELQSETADDDSDKTFTVPADKLWHIYWVWVEFASAAGGNRQIVVEIQDGSSNVVGRAIAGVTQPASVTYQYSFSAGVSDLTAVRDSTFVSTPIPVSWILPAGYVIRIYDKNVVAVAEDDMTIRMMVGDVDV